MKKNRGFTLIELLVTVAIVAILAAIALPSYINQTRKSRRSSAESTLQQIALLEERYRADHSSYLTANTTATWNTLGLGDPATSDPMKTYYDYSVTAVAASTGGTCALSPPATYTATATAKSTQTKDKAQGVTCTPLTYSVTWDTTNCVLKTTKGPNTLCWSN